jgi:peptide/nickel transport system substrate-binding protein
MVPAHHINTLEVADSVKRHLFLGIGLAGALVLTACASSDRGSETSSSGAAATGSGEATADASATGGPADPNGQIIFGAAGAPSMFDPLYATDGETFRVVRQMTEGLVAFKPGTADVEPALAKSWEQSADGLTWTFKLQEGVKFHDGTPFDAAAVCYNMDRMYSQTGAGITQAQYWADNMVGFKGQVDKTGAPVPSVYESCTASDAGDAVIKLTRYTSKFPSVLGLPSFSMQSPTALAQYDANNVVAEGDSFVYPAYATDHPTGTGPFKFQAYDKANNTVTLVRNDDYWGEKAKSKTLIFKIIPDETARKQELQAGTIDGYDLPNPADWDALKSAGFNLAIRPAFNILYLGITQGTNPALSDLRVRQAIAYALNRQQFVDSQLPDGANVAPILYPEAVKPFTQGVQSYDYDVQKAKDLLAQAGQSNLTVNFWWPTAVSRPYMPDPKSVFTALKADLEAVGITVKETSKDWNGGYLDGVEAHQADLFLLGWTGDYNTPDNFIGGFFTRTTNRFNTAAASWGQTLADSLTAADAIPDETQRNAAYDDINKKLMSDYLPAIPISSSPPALVLAANLQGITPSPLTDEKFVDAYKS